MTVRLVNKEDVERYGSLQEIIEITREAFAAYDSGNALMPPKSYLEFPEYNGDFRSMPAYISTNEWEAVGIKWVNVHPDNPHKHDLPTVLATIIYSDPSNGKPIAIMDGTFITKQRTGAAAAIATDYLTEENASSLGLIGVGTQAITQLQAISKVRPIREVIIYDIDEKALMEFQDKFKNVFEVKIGSVNDAAKCDILSTVTPAQSPVVDLADVGESTHINAIGADATGKKELSTQLLQKSAIVVDDLEQCKHSGEINIPYQQEKINDTDIFGTLGEVINNPEKGESVADELTLFDSTGLAIQDIAAAHSIVESCKHSNLEVFEFY